MKIGILWRVLPLVCIFAVPARAQVHNSVPLGHVAYDIIEIGVMRGIILSPPLAKPWSVNTVRQKLWEMLDEPAQILSSREIDTIADVLDSFERRAGLELRQGRYRTENRNSSFETGVGWESIFSVHFPETSIASVNLAEVYAGGDFGNAVSWNAIARGGFLYIERDEQQDVPSFFPHTITKSWDGGVLSLLHPGTYTAWPDDPSLAYGLEGELNGAFFNGLLQLRLGRIRRDWGPVSSGASLFLNAQARPFLALEGTVSPFSWLNISFLGGALEYYRGDSQWPDKEPFTNLLTLAQLEFSPLEYIRFSVGGSAVLLRQFNGALFTNLELRLPGLFTLWGSFFIDSLEPPLEDFLLLNGSSFAYQVGIRAVIRWLPFAVFTLRYTKVEPYCYTGAYEANGWEGIPSPVAFINGGESLGFYLPPNSDEFVLRVESRLFPRIKAHAQFQVIRRGADYGDGAVPGSSLRDSLSDSHRYKYFLMDGVYRWDNVIKLGGTFNFNAGAVPLAVFAEAGYVTTGFTINGTAGVGNKAEYEWLQNDPVYRARNGFIFSIGFRLFP
jgi:hypothetical protein